MGARSLSLVPGEGFTRTRGPCHFRQRDVTAVMKAVEAAGHAVSGVEVDPDGRIRVLIGAPASPIDDHDAELREFEAKYAG